MLHAWIYNISTLINYHSKEHYYTCNLKMQDRVQNSGKGEFQVPEVLRDRSRFIEAWDRCKLISAFKKLMFRVRFSGLRFSDGIARRGSGTVALPSFAQAVRCKTKHYDPAVSSLVNFWSFIL